MVPIWPVLIIKIYLFKFCSIVDIALRQLNRKENWVLLGKWPNRIVLIFSSLDAKKLQAGTCMDGLVSGSLSHSLVVKFLLQEHCSLPESTNCAVKIKMKNCPVHLTSNPSHYLCSLLEFVVKFIVESIAFFFHMFVVRSWGHRPSHLKLIFLVPITVGR